MADLDAATTGPLSSWADDQRCNFAYYDSHSSLLLDFETAMVYERGLLMRPLNLASTNMVPPDQYAEQRLPSEANRILFIVKKKTEYIRLFLHDSSKIDIRRSEFDRKRRGYGVPRGARYVAVKHPNSNVWIRTDPKKRRVFFHPIRELCNVRDEMKKRYRILDGSATKHWAYSKKTDLSLEVCEKHDLFDNMFIRWDGKKLNRQQDEYDILVNDYYYYLCMDTPSYVPEEVPVPAAAPVPIPGM